MSLVCCSRGPRLEIRIFSEHSLPEKCSRACRERQSSACCPLAHILRPSLVLLPIVKSVSFKHPSHSLKLGSVGKETPPPRTPRKLFGELCLVCMLYLHGNHRLQKLAPGNIQPAASLSLSLSFISAYILEIQTRIEHTGNDWVRPGRMPESLQSWTKS